MPGPLGAAQGTWKCCFVLALLLTAFLTIIMLRLLKQDFSRYMELDDDALDEEEVGVGVLVVLP